VAEWAGVQSGNFVRWQDLITRCAATGQWDAALTYAEVGSAAREDVLGPELWVGRIARQLQQFARAERLFQSAAAARPDDPQPWMERAALAVATGDSAAAANFLKEAERRNAFPENVAALREAGGLEASGERPEIPTTVIR